MTVYYEGSENFYLGSRAIILNDERDTASEWANEKITVNPAIKWILGRYVEADRANSNKQMWKLEELTKAQSTIAHSPLNILHRAKHIVGAIHATEMLYPLSDAAEDMGNDLPFIEALAAFWKIYFPEEHKVIQQAHDMGELFFSMECIAESLTCVGEEGCNETFDYAGPQSTTYCDHINSYASTKQFNKPHFLAAALIFPPARPGWKNAAITDMAQIFTAKEDETLHQLYGMIATEMPHLEPGDWEKIMAELLRQSETAARVEAEPDKKSPKQLAWEIRNGLKRR
jgi:hypothetical protein